MLLQIHNLVDWCTHTGTLQQWKQAGRVRYIGISHYHTGAYAELEKAMRTRSSDFVQLNYSIAEREAGDYLLRQNHENHDPAGPPAACHLCQTHRADEAHQEER